MPKRVKDVISSMGSLIGKIYRKKPLISIVMPVYNGEKSIRKSIDSVLKQTYSNYELLVVDNNSTDETKNIIQEYIRKSKKIRPLHCKRQGVSNARNLGIDLAKGKYICFLDADDIYENNVIEKRTEFVMGHDAPVTTTNWTMVNEKMETIIESNAREIAFSDFYQCPVNSDSVMFRSDIIKKVKFDPTLSNGEDWLTWARIARMGYTYMPITTCTVYYIQGDSTVRKNFFRHTTELLKVLDLIYSNDKKFLYSAKQYENGLTSPVLEIVKVERVMGLYFYEMLNLGKKYNDAIKLLEEYDTKDIEEYKVLGSFQSAVKRVFLNNDTEIQTFAQHHFDEYKDDISQLFHHLAVQKIFAFLEQHKEPLPRQI